MATVIRAERPQDRAAVRTLNERAFPTATEADLVDRLRENCPEYFALVAEEEGRVVGQVLFTPVTVEGRHGGVTGMGLAPMAVLPERQRQGIGSRLVKAGLQELDHRGCPFVVVLGHPDYYPRFGFTPASRYGVACEFPDVPEEAFMIRLVDPQVLKGVTGTARYRPEFAEVT